LKRFHMLLQKLNLRLYGFLDLYVFSYAALTSFAFTVFLPAYNVDSTAPFSADDFQAIQAEAYKMKPRRSTRTFKGVI